MKQNEMIAIKVRRVAVSIGAAFVTTAICAMSALADGIELWGADRYVQSGLIAQFDGLENVAYGAQHSDTATQWSSIGGTASGLKFSFSGRSGSVDGVAAVFKPDGAGYLTVTEKLEGSAKVDISDSSLADKGMIPLLKVPTALEPAADSALDVSDRPAGWMLKKKTEEGYVSYCLAKGLTSFLR